MRPTSAINVTSPIPLPLHLPFPLSFRDHLSGIRDFRCQKHILSRPVLMNGYTRGIRSFLFLLRRSFFLFQKYLAIDINGVVWIGHYDIGVLSHSVECNSQRMFFYQPITPRTPIYLIKFNIPGDAKEIAEFKDEMRERSRVRCRSSRF